MLPWSFHCTPPFGGCDSQLDVHSGCPQLVHHAAKFVTVPTFLAVARATLQCLQAELRTVAQWLNLFRRCEASLEQLTRDAEKLDREHAASADVLLHRQAKDKELLKEQSQTQQTMKTMGESLPKLRQTTGTSCTVEHQWHSFSIDLRLMIGATCLILAPTVSYTPCICKLVRPICEVATLFSNCSPLYERSLLRVVWCGCCDAIKTCCTAETLVDNMQRMYAAPCWAPHFFKLAKESDGWCTPPHSASNMATTVAALHDAQLLSDSALDFIKRCFDIHEVKHCMPKHSLSQSQANCQSVLLSMISICCSLCTRLKHAVL